jgi:hypothetical protein
MELSTRNKLFGTVTDVKLGTWPRSPWTSAAS